ncbi:hypothetical protein ACHWQZ_G018337 [Mnemiopsis leidyi]
MIRCVDAHRVIECEIDCCKLKANGTNFYQCCGGHDDQPTPSVAPSIITENPFFWTIFVLVILVIAAVIYCKRRERKGILYPEFVPLFRKNSMGITAPETESDYSLNGPHLYVDLDS